MRPIYRRLRKLEACYAPPKPPRLIVRYEGCDWEEPEEPGADIDENDPSAVVLTVQYVDMPHATLS
jgi:hypothetical protein